MKENTNVHKRGKRGGNRCVMSRAVTRGVLILSHGQAVLQCSIHVVPYFKFSCT